MKVINGDLEFISYVIQRGYLLDNVCVCNVTFDNTKYNGNTMLSYLKVACKVYNSIFLNCRFISDADHEDFNIFHVSDSISFINCVVENMLLRIRNLSLSVSLRINVYIRGMKSTNSKIMTDHHLGVLHIIDTNIDDLSISLGVIDGIKILNSNIGVLSIFYTQELLCEEGFYTYGTTFKHFNISGPRSTLLGVEKGTCYEDSVFNGNTLVTLNTASIGSSDLRGIKFNNVSFNRSLTFFDCDVEGIDLGEVKANGFFKQEEFRIYFVDCDNVTNIKRLPENSSMEMRQSPLDSHKNVPTIVIKK